MKTTFCILLLIFAASFTHSQAIGDPAQPDLSKFSSDRLKACQENSKLCGTDDSLSINDELATRLGNYSTDQILACYDDWKICGVEESRVTGWPISDYLAARGAPHDLLVRYWKERKFMIRNGIERVAYHSDTHEVMEFMQKVIRERMDDGEDLYWPANYLAKKCDPLGLSWLRNGRGRNQGGMQYQYTVELFGKCHYRQAIPLLVKSLYDFSGNVAAAAEGSLDALYPDHPKDLDTLEQVQKYYCRRAKMEGFRVHCTTK